MPHIKSRTVFYFNELSEAAKEKARQWYREGAFDYGWWDFVYEDAVQCAEIIGITISKRMRKNCEGKTLEDGHSIYFSGFSSQGDGACFEGTYRYAKGSVKKIKRHAPKDAELHRIASALAEVQKPLRYGASATMTQSGHYSHSGCMRVECSCDHAPDYERGGWEDTITQAMRDFADWIYHQLETEYEWQNEDAQVDDAIMANQYEFTELGRRA